MLKRILIILLVVVVLILLGLGIYGVWQNISAKKQAGESITLRDYFPFGKGGSLLPQLGGLIGGNTEDTPSENNGPLEQENLPRLRKITDNPVAGFTTLTKEVPVDPDAVPEPIIKRVTPTTTLTLDLKLNMKGAEVKELQKILNMCKETQIAQKGAGSPGNETELFTKAVQNALIYFQNRFKDKILEPQGLQKGTGVLDAKTREVINQPFDCEPEKVSIGSTIQRAVVRYVERSNGNIYDAFADTLDARRISNTTIPRIEEALFVDSGTQVLLRYLRDDNRTIETFLGKLPEQQLFGDSLPELTGSFLSQNIYDVVVSPDTKQLFFTTPFTNDVFGFIQDVITNRRIQVFSSPLRGWLPSWNRDGIFVTTKATGFGTSTLFKLDTTKDTKTPEKVIGNVYGMATLLSPDGQKVLYSRTNSEGVGLILYDRKTKKYTDLKLKTLVEKCVWNNSSTLIYCGVPESWDSGTYPDIWYQGATTFRDSLWRIDPSGLFGNTEIENISQTAGEDIDLIKPALDKEEKYLYFINKKTLSFWQFNITGI